MSKLYDGFKRSEADSDRWFLKVSDDLIYGPITLSTLNNTDPEQLHSAVKKARIRFIHRLIKRDPSQQCFEKGWLNRINSFTYS